MQIKIKQIPAYFQETRKICPGDILPVEHISDYGDKKGKYYLVSGSNGLSVTLYDAEVEVINN